MAELLGRLFGAGFVAGDLPGVTYTAQRCAECLEYFPDAGGCAQAAALHHWGEVVEYGSPSACSGCWCWAGSCCGAAGRTDRTRGTWASSPKGSRQTVATSLYGVAAAALALLSLDAFLVADGDGTGQRLSAAIVAAAMAAV